MIDKIWAANPGLPADAGAGGILVNQITMYCPVPAVVARKSNVPPTLSALATVFIDCRLAALRAFELPILICTSAPAGAPSWTVIELSLIGRPMSRIRPVPGFRLPSAAVLSSWEVQPAGLPLM